MKNFVLLCGMAFWMGLASVVPAAELTLKVVDKEPPKEFAEPIRAVLQSKALQLLDGDKPAYEFWLAKEVALKSKPESLAKGLDNVEATALIGAVSIPVSRRDYRNDELPAGLYTMRFALQQQDGNHLGSTEFLTFAVLVQAKIDQKLDGFANYKSLVKASAKDTTTDHPITLSLRPASAEANEPQVQTPAPEHKSLRVKVPAKAGADPATLTFEIVYEGHVNH